MTRKRKMKPVTGWTVGIDGKIFPFAGLYINKYTAQWNCKFRFSSQNFVPVRVEIREIAREKK